MPRGKRTQKNLCWFNGGPAGRSNGWAQNAYVIYGEKLDERFDLNKKAIVEGNALLKNYSASTVRTFMDTKDQHYAFSRFWKMLNLAQEREHKKEQALIQGLEIYVQTTLNQNPKDKQIETWYNDFMQAKNSDNLGAAYTLYILGAKRWDTIQQEQTSVTTNGFKLWKNFTQTSSTFSLSPRVFRTTYINKLKDAIFDKMSKLQSLDDVDTLTIDTEAILKETLAESLQVMQDEITQKDLTALKEAVGLNDQSFEEVFGANGKKLFADFKKELHKAESKITNKKEVNKDYPVFGKAKVNDIKNWYSAQIGLVFDKVNNGAFSEWGRALQQNLRGLNAKVTGTNQRTRKSYSGKEYDRSGKTDISTIISIPDFGNWPKGYEDAFMKHTYTSREVEQLKQQLPTTDFEVRTSLKNYISGINSHPTFEIEASGTWDDRLGRLKEMSDEANSKIEYRGGGDGINPFEKLIFLVVNTADGAIGGNPMDREKAERYLGAVAFAYMFDEYVDFIKEDVENGDMMRDANGRIKVSIFQAGDACYTASEIMKAMQEDLKAWADRKEDYTRLMNINLTYPSLSEVQTDYNKYRLSAWGDQGPGSTAHNTLANLHADPAYTGPHPNKSQAENLNLLAEEWKAVRDSVMSKGTLSVRMNRAKFVELINQFQKFA